MAEWDSIAWRKERDEKLRHWLKGNLFAMEAVVQLSTVSETWDDLVDQDKPVAREQIDAAFSIVLIRLQNNPFFLQYQTQFMIGTMIGVNAWMDANQLETVQAPKERALAFYIRNYCYEVVSIAAFCAGGWDWLREISLEMRMFFQHESYFTWEKRYVQADQVPQ